MAARACSLSRCFDGAAPPVAQAATEAYKAGFWIRWATAYNGARLRACNVSCALSVVISRLPLTSPPCPPPAFVCQATALRPGSAGAVSNRPPTSSCCAQGFWASALSQIEPGLHPNLRHMNGRVHSMKSIEPNEQHFAMQIRYNSFCVMRTGTRVSQGCGFQKQALQLRIVEALRQSCGRICCCSSTCPPIAPQYAPCSIHHCCWIPSPTGWSCVVYQHIGHLNSAAT